MELLGGTDIRIASSNAQFAVMAPKRGLFAGGGTTVRLPRQIPWPLAMELLLCADLVSAERAQTMGLLNAVVEPDQLMATARAFAQRIVVNAPLAVQATKKSALSGLYHDEEEIVRLRTAIKAIGVALDEDNPAKPVLTELSKSLRTAFERESKIANAIFQTDDAKEGPKAFAEKRPPRWTAS